MARIIITKDWIDGSLQATGVLHFIAILQRHSRKTPYPTLPAVGLVASSEIAHTCWPWITLTTSYTPAKAWMGNSSGSDLQKYEGNLNTCSFASGHKEAKASVPVLGWTTLYRSLSLMFFQLLSSKLPSEKQEHWATAQSYSSENKNLWFLSVLCLDQWEQELGTRPPAIRRSTGITGRSHLIPISQSLAKQLFLFPTQGIANHSTLPAEAVQLFWKIKETGKMPEGRSNRSVP